MMIRRHIQFFLALFLLFLPLSAFGKVERVVVIVLDQMRPDYIDTYDLPNLKKLRDESLDFKNANVGHFSANTIMSHPVIGTGLFPKHYGWSDEIFFDEKGEVGPAGVWTITSSLNLEQYRKLFRNRLPQPTGIALIKKKLGGEAISIGQKDYAALTMGGVGADQVITLSPKIKSGPWSGWRKPEGLNVPSYISGAEGSRFYLDCRNDYQTKETLYALDGNRYVPGDDPEHQGGDIWTADVALTVMQKNKKWRLLMITMGGIDKLGHIYGEMDNRHQQKIASKAPYNLEKMLKVADTQVGRLVEELKKTGLWDKTLLIVTADHGGVSAAKHFYGDSKGTTAHDNFYYGSFAGEKSFKSSKNAKRWLPGHAERAALGTANRIWLTDQAKKDLPAECRYFAKMPGAVAVYNKEKGASPEGASPKGAGDDWHYRLCTPYRGPELPSFLDPVTLLNTAAMSQSPDLVVQLADDTGYALMGDHGGFQEKSMRIPMMVRASEMTAGESDCPIRLVDLMPVVMQQIGVPAPLWLDGNTACLKQ